LDLKIDFVRTILNLFLAQQSTLSRSHSQASAFDENSVNVSQFVQLTETFLGDYPTTQSFDRLVTFVKDRYAETDEERMKRLMKVCQYEFVVIVMFPPPWFLVPGMVCLKMPSSITFMHKLAQMLNETAADNFNMDSHITYSY
jgi:hypothetical protein